MRLSHLGKLVLRGWEWLSTPDERFVLQSPHGARYDFRLGAGGALLMPRVERVKDE